MEYDEARQRLADVDNLADNVAYAQAAVEAIEADVVDVKARAQARVEAVEAALSDAKATLAAEKERLERAKKAATEVPEEYLGRATADLQARRAAKANYNEALAIAKQLGRDRAAVEGGTGAAAKVAGVTGNGG